MKYLNKFDFFKKRQIKSWLDHCRVNNYTINDDLTIDVDGNVDIFNKNKKNEIPFKFRNINGYFNCEQNELISLKNCPDYVGGDFLCCNNKLESLEFCPKVINGNFFCYNNKLKSLKYCPKTLNGSLFGSNNQLESLKDIDFVGGVLDINDNNISEFKYFPKGYTSVRCLNNPISDIINCINNIRIFSTKNTIKFIDYCIEYNVVVDNNKTRVLGMPKPVRLKKSNEPKHTILLDNLKEVLYMMDLEDKYDFDKLKKSKYYLIK